MMTMYDTKDTFKQTKGTTYYCDIMFKQDNAYGHPFYKRILKTMECENKAKPSPIKRKSKN